VTKCLFALIQVFQGYQGEIPKISQCQGYHWLYVSKHREMNARWTCISSKEHTLDWEGNSREFQGCRSLEVADRSYTWTRKAMATIDYWPGASEEV
jgi:hypothetical protein